MQIKPIEWKCTGYVMIYMVIVQIAISAVFSFALWELCFSWGDVRYVTATWILAIIVTASWNLYVKFKGVK